MRTRRIHYLVRFLAFVAASSLVISILVVVTRG
jgi:hypothetical protein